MKRISSATVETQRHAEMLFTYQQEEVMSQTINHRDSLPMASRVALLAVVLFGVLFGLLLVNTGSASAQTCVDDVTGVRNNCTAKDVRIAEIEVLPGSTDPFCASDTDTVDVLLRTRLIAGASERYDIGLFIATDGGNAYTGSCARGYLTPTSTDNLDVNITSGTGPFYNAEIGSGDTCGDIQQGANTFYNLAPLQLRCRDTDGDGFLDVGAIVSWDNTTNNLCTSVNDAVPNTKSKCNANPALRIPINVPPSDVRITKVPDAPIVNAGNQIGFTIVVTNTRTACNGTKDCEAKAADNVRITDTLPAGYTWVEASDPSNACTITSSAPSVLTCNWGTLSVNTSRSVRITAMTSITHCGPVENVVDMTYLSGNPRSPKSGQTTATTAVACSTIEVDKVTFPSDSQQPFTFRIRNAANNSVLDTFTLTDTQPIFTRDNLTPTLTYIVEETVPAGWQQTDSVCDNGNSPTAVQPLTSAAPGEPQLGTTVRCTFTNTQQVSVQAIKTVVGASGSFSVTLSGQDARNVDATPTVTGTTTWSNLLPGDYTIAEVDPGDNWIAGDFVCTIFEVGSGQRTDDATFALSAGERAVCEVANIRRGSITVTKVTEPADSEASFGFTSSFDPPFSLLDGQSRGPVLLSPGIYTVTESTLPPDWDRVSATCSDGSEVTAIDLQAGETITCTFVNRQRSSITVVKQTQGFDGVQYDDVFAFTSTGGLTATNPFALATSNTQGQIAFTDLISGVYSIEEQPDSNWLLASATCTGGASVDPAQIALGPGQDITCTFVNQRLVPGIQLIKLVTTIDDESCTNARDALSAPPNTPVRYCFTVANTGNVTITQPITLADPAIGFTELLGVSEIAPGASVPYTRTFNWGSTGGIYPNTATVTGTTTLGEVSDDDSAMVSVLTTGLSVQKLVGENGEFFQTDISNPYLTDVGTTLQWRWIISNTGNVTLSLAITDTLDGVDIPIEDLVSDSCIVPQTLVPGAGFQCDSDGFPAALGQHTNVILVVGCAETDYGATCDTAGDVASYITRPQLTVTKLVNNNWGGLLGVSDFPLQLSDGAVVTPLVSGQTVSIDAGSYTITETQQAGYTTAGFTGDCAANGALTMVNGAAYACEIVNEDTPAQLTVTKVVVSQRLDDSFDIYLDGSLLGTAGGVGETFGPVNIISGTHTVTETNANLGEYVVEYGGDCDANGDVVATIGGSYACTITNTRQASIVVVKTTIPENSAQAFDFSASFAPIFSLSDGQSFNSGLLSPGVYTVTETTTEGWEQLPASCTNSDNPSAITLQAGAIVTCTFTNRQLGQIQIEKRTDPAGSGQTFDFTASYNLGGFTLGDIETNTSPFLTTGAYTVTEVTPLPTGWSQTGFACDDDDSNASVINLAPGEFVTCVITNTIQRGQIIVDKITDPAQSSQVFTFTTDFTADFTLTDQAPAFVSGALLPVSEHEGGNYSVSEIVPDGWTQANATCRGDGNRRIDPDEIDLRPGETVTCEFTNQIARGQIIVEKVTDPAGAAQPFSFTANFTDTFQLRGGESLATSFTLLPTSERGVYTVTEVTPAGWRLASATCSDGSAPGAIDLTPGESVTCTFTNTLGLARILFEEPIATNAVNEPHVFTVTVQTSEDNGATWQPVANQVVTSTASGVGSPALQTCTTDSNGQCPLTINSATAGQTTLVASSVVNVLGLDIPVTTSGDTGISRNAVKTWVDLRVRIDPQQAANPLNDPHTFTISVTQNLGDGVWVPVTDGVAATVTIAPQPVGFTLVSDSCASPGTVNGECTVVINSSVAQLYTANATVTASVTGQTITRSTQNNQANLDAGGSGPATKTYVEGDVVINKTVEPTYTRTFTWTIEKTAAPDTLHIFDGASASTDYTVAVTKSDGVDSAFTISGTVTFSNISSNPAILNAPVDTLADGTPIALNCGVTFPYTLLQNAPLVCTYTQPFDDVEDANQLDTTNLVTVTTTSGSVFTTTAVVDFGLPTNPVNDSIQVTDTNTTTVWSASATSIFPSYSQSFTCENVADGAYQNGVAGYAFDNTAQIRYDEGDGPSVTETVNVNCYRPSVSKTATPSHVITYTWDITKTANVTEVNLFDGDSQVVTYTIEVIKDSGTPGSWAVSGSIVVTNPHPSQPITDLNTNLSDQLSGAGLVNAVVICPADSVAANASQTCTYTADLPAGGAWTNTATLVWFGQTYTGTASFGFNPDDADKVHDTLTVTDTVVPGSWTFEGSGSESYDRPLVCADIFGDVDYGVDGTISTGLPNVAVGRGDGGEFLTSDDETVTLNCFRPLVSKDANTGFTRTYTWTVEKTVDPVRLDLFDGESETVTYTINVVKSPEIDTDHIVTGTITIVNPHPTQAATFAVQDVLPGGLTATVSCGNGATVTVNPGATETCTYAADTSGKISGDNVVTATMQTQNGPRSYTGQAPVSFGEPTRLVDDEVTISDDNLAFGPPVTTNTTFSTQYQDVFGCWEVLYEDGTSRSFQNINTVTVNKTAPISDTATVDYTCYLPTVEKDIFGAFGRTYDWDLVKTANPTSLDLFEGESQVVTYTIDVTKTLVSEEDFVVTGTITISNPNPVKDLVLVSVLDELDTGSGVVNLDNACAGGVTVSAGATQTCFYSASVNGIDATSVVTNTATIFTKSEWWYTSAPQSLDFSTLSPSTINDTVTISDSQVAQTWSLSDSDTITYTLPQGCAAIDFNGGTVYNGTLVNTASVQEIVNRTSTATVDLSCYRLAVSKDANTAFTRQYLWDIAKTVDQDALDLFAGDQTTSIYTVTAFIVGQQDSGWSVDGTITISNPAPMPANVTSVVDVLPNGQPATVSCPNGVTVPANDTVACTYNAQPGSAISGDNVVTATLLTSAGTNTYRGAAPVVFSDDPTTELSTTVTVSDDLLGGALGTFTDGQSASYPIGVDVCTEVSFEEGQTSRTFTINNTASIDGTEVADSQTVIVTCYRPVVTKTANTTFTRTIDWTVEKTVDPVQLDLFDGETATVTYTVNVIKSGPNDSLFGVNGVISIFNPHPTQAATFSVQDVLPGGLVATVNCGSGATSLPVGAGQTGSCTYTASPASKISGTNVATATMPTDSGARAYSGAANVSFGEPTTVVDDQVGISDTNPAFGAPVTTSSTFNRSYPVSYGCENVNFGEGTTFSEQKLNTVTVDKTVDASDTATVDLSCYRLAVSKDANTAFTRQYFWDITKTVDQNALDLFAGDQASSTYTVTAFITGQQDSGWSVDGTITISNPAPMPANVTSLVDVLPNGQPATVSCPNGVAVPANSTATCTYSAQPGSAISGDNVVTATLLTSAGSNTYRGAAPVVFSNSPTTEIDKTVSVTDDLYGPLGQFNNGQSQSYNMGLACENIVFGEGETSQVITVVNTATIDKTDISDSETVTVTCWKPPVIKTANTRYNRVYDYDIVKTVEPAQQTIYFTDTTTFTYTLQVTKFIKEENGFGVSGFIRIDNPAPIDATLVSIEDILPDADGMTIICAPDNEAPFTVPAGDSLTCTYNAGLPDKATRTNEARATMSNGLVLSATAPVDFANSVVTPINDSAPISDTFWSEMQTVFTDTVFTYTEEFTCEGLAYNQETGFFSGAFTNQAQVLLEGGASDSATVTLNCYQLGLAVQKTATPLSLPEPGGQFTFDVAVVNGSPVPVTLNTLTDDVYGDITQATGRMTGTTCAVPQTLSANGGQYTCSFTANFTGQPGETETDTVTASGVDSEGTPVEASDSATIAITNVPSSITLTKTADKTVLPWPGGDVVFTLAVQNTSAVDAVHIETLMDNIYGDVTKVGDKVLETDCVVPQVVQPGATYSCAFRVNLTLAPEEAENFEETNVAEATGVDDDGQPVQASDDETVTVTAAQLGAIGNRVFIDINPDGASSADRQAGNQQQDYDENGQPIENNVPGITVLLFTADHVLVAQVQTDVDGNYRFDNVPPGEYYVVFVNNGVFLGAWTGYDAEIADDINSDADPSMALEPTVEELIDSLLGEGANLDAARTPTFSLAPGQIYLDLDAGLIDLSGAASVDLNGIIWLDANRDGIRQPNETVRITGVVVELYWVKDQQLNEITKIDQMNTDANGYFEFLGLDAGAYFVKMLIPNIYRITAQNVGEDRTIDSDINPTTAESEPVTVISETVSIDAGVYQTPTALDPIDEPGLMNNWIFLPTVQR